MDLIETIKKWGFMENVNEFDYDIFFDDKTINQKIVTVDLFPKIVESNYKFEQLEIFYNEEMSNEQLIKYYSEEEKFLRVIRLIWAYSTNVYYRVNQTIKDGNNINNLCQDCSFAFKGKADVEIIFEDLKVIFFIKWLNMNAFILEKESLNLLKHICMVEKLYVRDFI